MSYDVWQLAALVVTGLGAGMIGGLLGVGGSIIMIPAMAAIIPRAGQHLYQGVAMIVNVFVAGPAAVRHYTIGAAIRPILRWLVPGALAGVIVGVAMSNIEFFRGVNQTRLAKVFAIFLAYTVVYNVYRLIRQNRMPELDAERLKNIPPLLTGTVGIGMGLAAGLTGIGGGALAVPMQQIFLRMPLKNAIANSACTIVFSAIIGAVYKNATLATHGVTVWQSLVVSAMLIPSAFVGSWIGANLTHKLPRTPVRLIFIAMLIIGTWKMWTYAPRNTSGSEIRQSAAATQPVVTTRP